MSSDDGVMPTLVRLADAMHEVLLARADALIGCTEGSPEDAELAQIADVIDAYEASRHAIKT